jgi:hypothetical protein
MITHTHEPTTIVVAPLCPHCTIKMKQCDIGQLFDAYGYQCPNCRTVIDKSHEERIDAIHCTDCDKIITPVEQLDGRYSPLMHYTDGCPTCERIRTETQRHARAVSLLRERYGTTQPESIKDFFTR